MKSAIKIGRDNSNDIVINEPRVSRNHAIITILDNGSYEVKDLGSSNGTFINGKRIERQIITPADKLTVADSIVNWLPAFASQKTTAVNSVIQEAAFAKIRKTITVGALPENHMVIPDDFVSGYHAKISLLKSGNYFIQDLGSSNGIFVNGARVAAKNFAKTDVVKIATADLPENWFQHESLTPRFYKDNKKKVWGSIILLVLASAAVLIYFNYCNWFNKGCNLTPGQLYEKNKNSIVHIEHQYYYTIEAGGKTYYVGRNKEFKITEANTSKDNLLPYATVQGSGAFINADGTILTSPLIINPWFNKAETEKMLQEVKSSKTLPRNMSYEGINICGQTYDLKFLVNGQVNNPQNYISAAATRECAITDSNIVTIQSVKKAVPEHASVLKYFYDTGSVNKMHKTNTYYFALPNPLQNNKIMTDSFYVSIDSFNINTTRPVALNAALPQLLEGSAVLNERGELVGIVQWNKLVFLPRFYNQLKH